MERGASDSKDQRQWMSIRKFYFGNSKEITYELKAVGTVCIRPA